MSLTKENTFSNYGNYEVSDKLDLHLPKTEIYLKRKSNNRLSYYRKNSSNQEIRKSILQSDESTRLELCPILPLHLPAKKTHDLIFLRLDESIFVEKKSTINVLVQFPIEIGLFLINSNDESKELFDCFTCEPMHSRFALYGTPEKGTLCMYSKVKLLDDLDLDPYVFAKLKISLTNELTHGVFVRKLIFPITSHTIYYIADSSEVHIDNITALIKEDVNNEIIEINREEYVKKSNNWKLVSYSDDKDNKPFVMDKGFD
ncbi:conserved hypothetical protein [metagenome]